MMVGPTQAFKDTLLESGRRAEVCAEFWRRADRGQISFQRCDACGFVRYPPAASCPSCGQIGGSWTLAEAPVLVAWTITHPEAADRLPSKLRSQAPYGLGLARFSEMDDFLLPVRLDVDDAAAVAVGQPLELHTDSSTRSIVCRPVNA